MQERHLEYIWLNQQFGCAERCDEAHSQFCPVVRLTVCEGWNCDRAKNRELQYSAAADVWQGSTLNSAIFCPTLWSKLKELLDRVNSQKPVVGFTSYADDFAVIVGRRCQRSVERNV